MFLRSEFPVAVRVSISLFWNVAPYGLAGGQQVSEEHTACISSFVRFNYEQCETRHILWVRAGCYVIPHFRHD